MWTSTLVRIVVFYHGVGWFQQDFNQDKGGNSELSMIWKGTTHSHKSQLKRMLFKEEVRGVRLGGPGGG